MEQTAEFSKSRTLDRVQLEDFKRTIKTDAKEQFRTINSIIYTIQPIPEPVQSIGAPKHYNNTAPKEEMLNCIQHTWQTSYKQDYPGKQLSPLFANERFSKPSPAGIDYVVNSPTPPEDTPLENPNFITTTLAETSKTFTATTEEINNVTNLISTQNQETASKFEEVIVRNYR